MRFRLLGPLEVYESAGGQVPLGGAKQRALLGLLLVHANEVVSSPRLIEELWAGRPPETAMSALHVHVSGLRKAIGDEPRPQQPARTLVTQQPGYVLRVAPGELDMDRFEKLLASGSAALARGEARLGSDVLREALELWRGPPLADFTYESWAQTPIVRLEELRMTALEDRIAADLALGRHHEAIAELEALVQAHPLRERVRSQLMIALYRCGRHADALEVYRAGRQSLVEELGIEPSRELQELERAMLLQDPQLDLAAPDPSPAGRTARAAPTPPAPSGGFVGRERELRSLVRGFECALAGSGRMFVISGDPGIGKSSIADELAQVAAARGARVLVGRCWEAGGAPAYWPWIQILRSYERATDANQEQLDVESATVDVVQLVPELGRLLPRRADPPPIDPEGARFRLFDSVASLLRSAARRQPLVLVLDDLHAADAATLLLLRYLAADLDRARILVLVAYRDIELGPDHPLGPVLADLRRQPCTHLLPLRGLPRADVRRLLEMTVGLAPAEAIVRAVERETQGNPLFVAELARLLASEGRLDDFHSSSMKLAIPAGVREIIDRRLRHLSEPCKEVLKVAAVLGREFDLEALDRMRLGSRDELLELLDEALVAQVIDDAPSGVGRFRFAHGLIRDAVYGSLPAVARMRLHRDVGKVLEELHAAAPDAHLAELAHHFVAALPLGDPSKALEYAHLAGERAMALTAFEEAARLFGMALEAEALRPLGDPERCELLLAAGEAQMRAGDALGSKDMFLRAADIARTVGLPEQFARAALGYGGRLVYGRAGADQQLIDLLESALEALDEKDSILRARLLARLAGALRDRHAPEQRLSASAEAVAMARRLGDRATLAYALDGRWASIWFADNPHERLEIATELIEIADEIGDKERAVESRAYRQEALMELGDPDGASADSDAQIQIARDLGQPVQLWLAHLMRAMPAIFEGRFEDAEELVSNGVRYGERAYGDDARQSHCQQLFALRREQGRLDEIVNAVVGAADHYTWYPMWRCLLAWLYADLGRVEDARREFETLARNDFGGVPRDNTWRVAMAALTEVCIRLGDVERAATLYELQLPFAGGCGLSPEICVGSVSRCLGMLASAMSRFTEAADHLDDALALNASMRGRPWVAHTQREMARMLLLRDEPGDRARAFELIELACTSYRMLGMEAWADRARALGPTRLSRAVP